MPPLSKSAAARINKNIKAQAAHVQANQAAVKAAALAQAAATMVLPKSDPNTKEEFTQAARQLFASVKGTKNAAKIEELISGFYQLACCDIEENGTQNGSERIWACSWRDVVREIETENLLK